MGVLRDDDRDDSSELGLDNPRHRPRDLGMQFDGINNSGGPTDMGEMSGGHRRLTCDAVPDFGIWRIAVALHRRNHVLWRFTLGRRLSG